MKSTEVTLFKSMIQALKSGVWDLYILCSPF